MNVVWLTKSAAKYKMDLLNEIGRKVNLTVLFVEHQNKNRAQGFYSDLKGNYKLVKLNNYSDVDQYIKSADVFVDSYYASRWGYHCVSVAKRKHVKTIIQADGGIAVKRNVIIDKGISYFMNRHDYILSSSEITDRYFNYYLKKQKKTYHYHISSLNESDIVKNKEYFENKEKYKKELNLEGFVFISVGQMIPRKGFDILLKAYAKTKLNDLTQLLIIGGKPTEELCDLKESLYLTNVKFIEAIPKEKLNQYYAASDAFVFSTREDIWGLVVNEALSFGLPLISSDNAVAAEHFKKYEDVGILVENENVDGFSNAMQEIYVNQELRKKESKKAIERIRDYTIEQSAKDIVLALAEVISRKENENDE